MLNTKSQGHRPSGSGREAFLKGFLPYMDVVAIFSFFYFFLLLLAGSNFDHYASSSLVMRPGPFEQTFVPLS